MRRPGGTTRAARSFAGGPRRAAMLRLLLAVSLTAFGASCGPDPSEAATPEGPTTLAEADAVPAAPPVSNAAPVVAAEAAGAPADTVDAAERATRAAFETILADAAGQSCIAVGIASLHLVLHLRSERPRSSGVIL